MSESLTAYLEERVSYQHNMLAYPSYYTEKEAGNWRRWPKGLKLEAHVLNNPCNHDFMCFEGLTIHAIAWGEISAGFSTLLRWDTENGFTEMPGEIFF